MCVVENDFVWSNYMCRIFQNDLQPEGQVLARQTLNFAPHLGLGKMRIGRNQQYQKINEKRGTPGSVFSRVQFPDQMNKSVNEFDRDLKVLLTGDPLDRPCNVKAPVDFRVIKRYIV